MKTSDFTTAILVDQTPEEAFNAINNVSGWWTGKPGIEGSTDKLNDEFTYVYEPHHYSKQKITELIPGKRLVWLVTDCNMPWYSDKKEWANTKLIFDLKENNGVTDLKFTHEGLTPDVECYKDCEPGWTHWIKTSLQSYLTTGQGVFRKPTK